MTEVSVWTFPRGSRIGQAHKQAILADNGGFSTICASAAAIPSSDAVRSGGATQVHGDGRIAVSGLNVDSIQRRWRQVSSTNAGTAGGGAIYGLGIFGAFVYYWQQADSFWEYVLSFVQALFWPAFMVYEVFSALGG